MFARILRLPAPRAPFVPATTHRAPAPIAPDARFTVSPAVRAAFNALNA